jgi:DNA-binding NarL/FixJ family response regulator
LIGWGQRYVKKPSHIFVLIEGIIKKRQIDFNKVRGDFDLTKRELEVLKLICIGLTNKEISKELAICEYTVKDHLKNIMRKMNVTSRSRIITCIQ